jgi:acyl transferase domain-containing protein/acyl carrier protein
MDKRRDVIEAWLVEQVAHHTGLDPQRIDIQQPLTEYGLDSIVAVELTADLEEWLGCSVPETLIWDNPTIRAIARAVTAGTDEQSTDDAPVQSASGERPRGAFSSVAHQREAVPAPSFVGEPIAVVGLACRVPGGRDAEAFWQVLLDGIDATTEVPAGRERRSSAEHTEPERGGFLPDIDLFDAPFFNISPREASHMDPQQRLLLEVAWEALEHAGQAPEELAGSQTGVFVGISTHDYDRVYAADHSLIDIYTNTGNAHSIAASRLAYVLDLQGPSMAIDTACSSSLVAIHLACQSLRSGETSLALAGGVNIMLSSAPTIGFARARMISPRGCCRPFDAEADGLVRAEGCGVVVLKRAADACACGDRILALIRGSAVNQDGRSQGLTAPNGQAQQRVITRALHAAGVEPGRLEYIVAQGTGTPLGDAVEFEALQEVLGERASDERLCALGSIKANIGHLEAASGVASVIAAILALQHETIPPQIHFQQANARISLERAALFFPREPVAWPQCEQPRMAGVSALSFSGTNVHLVLEEAPHLPAQADVSPPPLYLLPLSARSEPALRDLIEAYRRCLTHCPPERVADICYTAGVGRAHFERRVALLAETPAALLAGLQEVRLPAPAPEPGGGLAFLCGCEGAEYAHMGRQLYEMQPVFRAALDRCAALLAETGSQPLLAILYPAPDRQSVLQQPGYRRLATFALEYALTCLWQSWGILPDIVAGYGVGVYVAATLAGAVSLEDVLVLVSEQEHLWSSGGLQDFPAALEQRSCVLHPPDLEDAALAAFERVVNLLPSHPLTLPLLCTTTGQYFPVGARLDAGYWRRHLLGPLRLAESLEELARRGMTTFLEIGPGEEFATLGAALQRDGTWFPGLSRKMESDWHSLWHAAKTLYVAGSTLHWSALYQGMAGRRVSLPGYPFQRERYWVAPAPVVPVERVAETAPSHPLLGQRLPQHQLR